MNRVKPYKIFLVLAVMIAGVVCLLLPEKKVMPVADVSELVKPSMAISDTIQKEKQDCNSIFQ